MTFAQVSALIDASKPKRRAEQGTFADLLMFTNAKVG